MSFTVSPDGLSITCHDCGFTSNNPNDVMNRYCGKCHKFHEEPNPGLAPALDNDAFDDIKKILTQGPTPADLDMVLEATAGKPLPRSPEQGIADMQARLRQLTEEKTSLLEVMEGVPPARYNELVSNLNSLNNQIKEAQERLAEYRVQKEGQN
jgi:hypothetical protein